MWVGCTELQFQYQERIRAASRPAWSWPSNNPTGSSSSTAGTGANTSTRAHQSVDLASLRSSHPVDHFSIHLCAPGYFPAAQTALSHPVLPQICDRSSPVCLSTPLRVCSPFQDTRTPIPAHNGGRCAVFASVCCHSVLLLSRGHQKQALGGLKAIKSV